jgi:hypothetical protein
MQKMMICAALSVAALSAPATATTVYQSLPDLTVAPIVRSYCSSCNVFLPFRIYDRFTLANDATVNSVTFAVDRSIYANSAINLSFFTPNGARPGAEVASYDLNFADLTSQNTATDNLFLVTADIGSLALSAGTYDISFYNPNGLAIPAYFKSGGTLYQSGNFFQGESFYTDRAAAFSLDAMGGAVPEPATWAMMIGGMGIVGGAMRRRRSVSTKVSFA